MCSFNSDKMHCIVLYTLAVLTLFVKGVYFCSRIRVSQVTLNQLLVPVCVPILTQSNHYYPGRAKMSLYMYSSKNIHMSSYQRGVQSPYLTLNFASLYFRNLNQSRLSPKTNYCRFIQAGWLMCCWLYYTTSVLRNTIDEIYSNSWN